MGRRKYHPAFTNTSIAAGEEIIRQLAEAKEAARFGQATIADMTIALDATRTQLRLTAEMLKEINSEAWADVAHACEVQARVADRALQKAKGDQ